MDQKGPEKGDGAAKTGNGQSNIIFYYMAVSHKDGELPNSRI